MFMGKVTRYKQPNSHGVLNDSHPRLGRFNGTRGVRKNRGRWRWDRMWRLEFAAPENTVKPKEPIGRGDASGQGSPFRSMIIYGVRSMVSYTGIYW